MLAEALGADGSSSREGLSQRAEVPGYQGDKGAWVAPILLREFPLLSILWELYTHYKYIMGKGMGGEGLWGWGLTSPPPTSPDPLSLGLFVKKV